MRHLHPLPAWAIWGLALPLVALNAWVILQIVVFFHSLFGVFITAILLSFVLNYPVRLLQRFRIPRISAVLIVVLLTLGILVILGVTLIPTLIEQINELATRFPTWIASGSEQLQSFQDQATRLRLPVNTRKWFSQFDERLSAQLQTLSGQILNFLLDTIGRVFDLLLTVVVTFYLLLNGDRVWRGIFQWFPPKLGAQVRSLLKQSFHNYFAGQVTLALLIGTAMIVAFLLLGIPFGLLFGLGVGVLALFPFGTGLGICIVSFLTALQNLWLGLKVLVAASLVDLVIENAIAPQLIGGFTGLNPVWILAALIVGAKLGGILGLIMAVPVAGFIKSIFESLVVAKEPAQDTVSTVDE
jgi:predicted PurR-regulated permease PerM